MYYILEQFVS